MVFLQRVEKTEYQVVSEKFMQFAEEQLSRMIVPGLIEEGGDEAKYQSEVILDIYMQLFAQEEGFVDLEEIMGEINGINSSIISTIAVRDYEIGEAYGNSPGYYNPGLYGYENNDEAMDEDAKEEIIDWIVTSWWEAEYDFYAHNDVYDVMFFLIKKGLAFTNNCYDFPNCTVCHPPRTMGNNVDMYDVWVNDAQNLLFPYHHALFFRESLYEMDTDLAKNIKFYPTERRVKKGVQQ